MHPGADFPQPASFTTAVHFEQNLVWRRNLPDYIDGEDEWFWKQLNVFGLNHLDIVFTLQDFAIDAGAFDFEIYLRGVDTL